MCFLFEPQMYHIDFKYDIKESSSSSKAAYSIDSLPHTLLASDAAL